MINKTLYIISFFVAGILLITGCNKQPDPSGGGEPIDQPDWIIGADMSLLPTYLKAGAVYKDEYGNDVAVLPFFREKGFNYLRVRLFVNPNPETAACQDLAYVQDLILAARSAGYRILLDFHYSDTWADPGKQFKPAAWTELDQEKLANRVYSYTKETLRTLMKNNAVPDMIQIGNEVTFGMLWDTARVDVWESQWNTTSQWNYFCRLLSLASKACREVCPDAWVMIHSDRGGDEVSAVRFFNQMQVYNVDYDIIGISYYPFWHGPLRQLKDCMDGLRMNFPEKKVNIVEVAFPYHEWGIDQNASYEPEYPATPEGQKQFFIDFIKTIKQCSNVNGFMYWFPEETYSPEKEILKLHRGVFDNWTGKALQVMGVFAN